MNPSLLKVIHLTDAQFKEIKRGETVFVSIYAIKRLRAQTTAIQAGTFIILELRDHEVDRIEMLREWYDEETGRGICVDAPNAPSRGYETSMVAAPFWSTEVS
jgi:hypothetical protein